MSNETKKEKQEIKGVLYEEQKMQQVINILNNLPVSGLNNVKALGIVFDILTNPIQFDEAEPKK